MRPRWHLTVLATGVFAVGWAAIFVRLANDAPALTIAAYRMAIGAVVVGGAWLALDGSSTLRHATRRDAGLLLLSGLLLAFHFWAWFASLERTSVASSVVIVTMQPLIAALIAFALFRERPTRAEYLGLALAFVGLVVIAGADLGRGGLHLHGDALALAGAAFAAGYLALGRRLQPTLGALGYSAGVYAIATVVLWLLIAVVQPELGPFDGETWLWIALLALVPQVIGHTAINWSLGHFRVVTVGLAILGEPVISSLIAIPVLGERPSAAALVGGACILSGVFIALRRAGSPSAAIAVE